MTLENLIPEIWSARLLANLHTQLVYSQPGVINRDYEGEIRAAGDTVRISSIGAVTLLDYTKNTDLTAPEVLSDAHTTLLISQQKAFNFLIDDIDAAQQKPKVMNEAMREAGFTLAKAQDTYVAAQYSGVDAGNVLGSTATPITFAAPDDAYEALVDMAVILDEDDTPDQSRWAIVPPWFHGLLLKDDRFVKSGTTTGDSVLRVGQVGEAAGFAILKSNTVPNTAGADWKIMAGHSIAWTLADQIVSLEGYRPEKRFADAMKGLHVYGAKVTRPKNLVLMHATRPA